MTKPKFINSVRELGKAYRDERKKKQPIPSDEFCPKCLCLKRIRNPSGYCDHLKLYYFEPEKKSMNEAIDKLSEVMVKNIANKIIKAESTYTGKRHQRHWYLQAQKMLKKLMVEYKRVCGEAYQ